MHDRISGKSWNLDDGTLLAGRVVFCGEGSGSLNDQRVTAGHFLLPVQDQNWRFSGEDGRLLDGKFPCDILLSDRIIDGLEIYEEQLDGGELLPGFSWEIWIETSPLDLSAEGKLKVQDQDRRIDDDFPSLQSIFKNPSDRFDLIDLLEDTGRCRRPSPRAIQHLSIHSAHWNRRTLTGVDPKKVLSRVRVFDLDIYENRVTVRLVDRLDRYLAKRLAFVEDELAQLGDFSAYEGAHGSSSHHVVHRISQLIGELFDRDARKKAAEETLETLKDTLQKVRILKHQRLYQAIPVHAGVSSLLRSTNLFSNDRNYKKVADLWRTIASSGREDAEEQFERNQRRMRMADRYSRLLLLHALDNLEFKPGNEGDGSAGKGWLRFDGPGRSVFLKQNPDQTVSVFREDRAGEPDLDSELVVVALACEFSRSDRPEMILEFIDSCVRAASQRSGSTRVVALHLTDMNKLEDEGVREKLESLAASSVLKEENGGDRIQFLPVAPSDWKSVERFARAIRHHLQVPDFKWSDEVQCSIPRPPAGMPPLELKRRNLCLELQNGILSAFGPPGKTELTLLTAWKAKVANHCMARNTPANDRFKKKVEKVLQWAKGLKGYFDRIKRCPCCSVPAGRDKNSRERFLYRCDGCKSEWGLQICKKDPAHKIPYIIPGGLRKKGQEILESDRGEQERDRDHLFLFGRDLLSVPVKIHTDGIWEFRCPRCE